MSGSVDMQELFKEAARIAAVVPEAMQEAAFHRALDMLTTGEQPHGTTGPPRGARKRSSSGGDRGSGNASGDDRVAQVSAISRDDAPEVDQEASVQGRSIALLLVAKREAEVDGLTAPEIAKILTEKFRHRTTRQAVQQAMDAAGNMIDRQRNGNSAAVYRVMKTGEDWLATSADERPPSGISARRRPAAKKSSASATANAAGPNKASGGARKAASAKKASGTGRRTGPKAVLEALISEGYFREPRGMADIRQHIRDQRAISFENGDLSPTLIRLLREGKLKRAKTDNQYVYTAS